MEYSTLESWQEISVTGVIYEMGSLYDRFQQVPDPRDARGKRYSLVTLLVIIFLGKLCRQDSPVEIADWAHNHADELAGLLGLAQNRMPHHNTIRRVYRDTMDEEAFDRLAQEYSQQEQRDASEVLAMDGKTLCGTGVLGVQNHTQVLSLYATESQHVLAQTEVATTENEISAAPRVLSEVDLAGKVVTGDALLAQKALSTQILTQKGAYLWPIKENHPRLYQDLQTLFAAPEQQPKPGFGKISTDFQTATQVNAGHGRIERRTLQTSCMMNDYVDWPGLGQVYRLERKFSWMRQGKVYKTSCQTEYGLTSLTRVQASPAKLLQVRRQHWYIETGLHYRRDVTFKEDATRMTKGAAGRILATIHNLVIALIKRAGFSNAAKARRWFAGHLPQAFALLTTNSRL
jgi:predicted transposase YbfD/YdcC